MNAGRRNERVRETSLNRSLCGVTTDLNMFQTSVNSMCVCVKCILMNTQYHESNAEEMHKISEEQPNCTEAEISITRSN